LTGHSSSQNQPVFSNENGDDDAFNGGDQPDLQLKSTIPLPEFRKSLT